MAFLTKLSPNELTTLILKARGLSKTKQIKVEQFYPNLGSNLKSIIAAVLQERDPQQLVGLQRDIIKEPVTIL